MSDIEVWAADKRATRHSPCPICLSLPKDLADNVEAGWNKLGFRGRQLRQYLVDRGHDEVSRYLIEKHFKEKHVRDS